MNKDPSLVLDQNQQRIQQVKAVCETLQQPMLEAVSWPHLPQSGKR